MSLEGKSLCLLTPMYGNMGARNWFQSVIQLSGLCLQAGVKFSFSFVGNESLIQRARNRLVDSFLKDTDCTHAVFIDADIGFQPHEVLAMMEFDRDIMGAGCVKKGFNWLRIQAAIAKNGPIYTAEQLARMAGDYVINWNELGEINFSAKEPVEVRHLGTGLLMIKREVFEKFREHYPDRWYESKRDPASNPGPTGEFFRTGIDPLSQDFLSEDYWFCEDSRAFGAKVWLAPWVRTTHLGTYEFIADIPSIGRSGAAL